MICIFVPILFTICIGLNFLLIPNQYIKTNLSIFETIETDYNNHNNNNKRKKFDFVHLEGKVIYIQLL